LKNAPFEKAALNAAEYVRRQVVVDIAAAGDERHLQLTRFAES
jgi:hypothetical protein